MKLEKKKRTLISQLSGHIAKKSENDDYKLQENGVEGNGVSEGDDGVVTAEVDGVEESEGCGVDGVVEMGEGCVVNGVRGE